MKEVIFIKKYELIAIEEFLSTHEIEANSFEDAKSKLEKQINSGELPLEDLSNCNEIKWKNKYSKILNNNLSLIVKYNAETKKAIIACNDKTEKYPCISVADLIFDIKMFCECFLEDKEIATDLCENSNDYYL